MRNLVSSRGEVDEAGPSLAVQMVGLNAVPSAGDDFRVCDSEQEVHIPPCPVPAHLPSHTSPSPTQLCKHITPVHVH